jgi:hypothetical protein
MSKQGDYSEKAALSKKLNQLAIDVIASVAKQSKSND